ncbi:MAG: hypothetical protein HC880_21870 [Bacteroidia bacterium]|nr:hypothetical protein [Bacteroidia bacterium]
MSRSPTPWPRPCMMLSKPGRPGNAHPVARYYFYNVPQEYGYRNPSHTQYEETARIISRLNPQDSAVIIISDAGAARGSNSDARFKATLRFIVRLKKATQKIVWLNPLPEYRWEKTTAWRIARFVPMFSLTDQHPLQQAINKLRGK